MTAIFQQLKWYMGVLLVMAGLIMPAMETLDAVTATPAVGKIVKIGRSCQKRVCLGRCNWQRLQCAQMQAAKAEGYKTKIINHAKVSFPGEAGPATAWARFSKLELKQARVGDPIDIQFRGPKPYYLTTPFSFDNVGKGLLISLVGLLLLFSDKMGLGSETGAAVAGKTEADDVSSSRTRAIVRGPAVRAEARSRHPGSAVAPRIGAVQRNKGWLRV